MLSILNVVAPVFGLVTLGYLAVRLRLYPASGVRGLIAFVNNFGTPALLFRAMLSIDFQTAFNVRIIGGFYAGAIIAFIIGVVVSRTLFGSRPGDAVASGFSGAFTNIVLLGLPILLRAYDEEALPTIYSIVGIHAPVLFSLGILCMELSRRGGKPVHIALVTALRRMVTNPILIGISLGIAGNILGFRMPEPVDAMTAMLAAAVVPAALFGLGGALNEYSIRDNWLQAAAMAALKLMLHPALAWLIMVPLLGVDHQTARYAIVLAGMPTGINAYVFATQYNRSVEVAASTILIGTAASVLSVSFWLFMMRL